MKKLIVIAIALGFVSASVFAQGYGSYGAYAENRAAEEQALAAQAAQYQITLAQQVMIQKLVAKELAAGDPTKYSEITKAYLKKVTDASAANTKPVAMAPQYEQQYTDAMAMYRAQYLIKNPQVLDPYTKQEVQIEGQTNVNTAKNMQQIAGYTGQEAVLSAYDAYLKAKCHSNSAGPADAVTCSKQYLNDSKEDRYAARYSREEILKKMLNI
ncbi:MAG: hypothetical protein WCQ53_01285 [bacterium]